MGNAPQRRHTSTEAQGGRGRRYGGIWMAKVLRNNDPRELARVKVKVLDIGGENALAWARVLSPLGGEQTGAPIVPEPDTLVWVMFEAEDVNRPVVLGAGWPQIGENSQIPAAALGDTDDVRSARGGDSTTGAGGVSLTEPGDPFAAVYPNNRVYKSPAGHLIELDDTDGAERISITHGTSKSWVEFHPDGSLVIGVKDGDRYVVIDKDDKLHVKGRQDIVIDDEFTIKVAGQARASFQALRAIIDGKVQTDVTGAIKTRAREVTVEAQAGITLKSPGNVALGPGTAPGNIVTTTTHPLDYITGIPIQGAPSVSAG